MNKFTTLLVIFFVLHSIEGKLEGTSKNSFLHFLNPQKNELCSATPLADKTCLRVTYDGQGQVTSASANHCQKNEYCMDAVDLKSHHKCKGLLKFFGEPCVNDDDCYTKKCKDQVCIRKDSQDTCFRDRECGLKEYCRYPDEKATIGTCTSFQDSEIECNHSNHKLGKCHPKYECSVMGKCVLRGVKKAGEKVSSDFECESFKADYVDHELICTDKYDEQDYGDLEKKGQKEALKSINWADENLKLSDYTGENIGSAFKMDQNYQQCLQMMGKDLCDCAINLSKQVYAGVILSEKNEVTEDLPDKIIKDVLSSSHYEPKSKPGSSYFAKLGLGFIIFILGLF